MRRERDDGLYQPMTYLAFKISQEITVTLLHSLPVSVMIWYTVQLQVRRPYQDICLYSLQQQPETGCILVLYRSLIVSSMSRLNMVIKLL